VRGDGHYQYEAPPESVKEKVARIEAVCEDFAVPLAAAALQFPLAHPAVVSVMPGTSKIRHLNEMRRLMRNPIPADFWQALRQEGLVREDAPVPPGAEESEDA
jgi:D-threo-aldose 1-dehydrogenase